MAITFLNTDFVSFEILLNDKSITVKLGDSLKASLSIFVNLFLEMLRMDKNVIFERHLGPSQNISFSETSKIEMKKEKLKRKYLQSSDILFLLRCKISGFCRYLYNCASLGMFEFLIDIETYGTADLNKSETYSILSQSMT